MANRGTITYNGQTISTEDRDGSFAVYYDGVMKANIAAGHSQSLNCSGKVMKTDVVIGGKTLNCAKKKMASNITVSVISLFPSTAPSSYSLIGTYTSSQTWTAPENGYFQIEVFGASGTGGTGSGGFINASGGGGGGGGYSCSTGVTLNQGDTIVLTVGAVGSTTKAVVNSSYNNSYDHTLQVTSGANGGTAVTYSEPGTGGAGGTASGGKTTNKNGNAGGSGTQGMMSAAAGGAGGTAGYSGGNAGGAGGNGSTTNGTNTPGTAGKKGFIKIYRGNTNL